MSILEDAAAAVHGPRNADYGHPLDNHSATAAMVAAYLSRRYGVALPLDAQDVCAFNILQKVSRLANTPGHRDSLVDIAGYAANIEMAVDEQERRGEG